jgi:hypothetical protein
LPTQNALSEKLTDLILVTGFGIRVHHGANSAIRAAYTPDVVIAPDGTEEVMTVNGAAQQVVERKGGGDVSAIVSTLPGKNILPPSNRTDLTKGIFETDTGEILLDATGKKFFVNTPRSQALILPEGASPSTVGNLEVENMGPPSSLLLSALGHEPIQEASHCLLILSGNALNSGMTFRDNTKREMLQLGTAPTLAQILRIRLRLHHLSHKDWKVWALAQNGTRQEELPVEQKEDGLEVLVDTGKLKNGPTQYFELVSAP